MTDSRPQVISRISCVHLAAVTDHRGAKTLTYSYTAANRLASRADSDGGSVLYHYDSLGRLDDLTAPNTQHVTYVRDDGGRIKEKWFPNGAKTLFSYNADHTLAQVLTRTGGSTVISQHDYTYDGVGNRATLAELYCETTTPSTYLYDELNRLKEVRNTGTNALIEGYTYDPLGNRISRTTPTATEVALYDAANQLTELRDGSASGPVKSSFGYDDNGNLLTKTEAGVTTQYQYDVLNRLSQVSKPWEPTHVYGYDDQGRRTSKTAGGSATNLVYDGSDVALTYGAAWSSSSAVRFTHGLTIDEPLARTAGSQADYYHPDGLGSIAATSGASGSASGTLRHDAWGNLKGNSGVVMQYGYTGREPDETGLIYYRSRYYDPTIGRFTQRDPIGLAGGMNMYAYVGGNPTNFVDPYGENPVVLGRVLIGGLSGAIGGAISAIARPGWESTDVARGMMWGAIGGIAVATSVGSITNSGVAGATGAVTIGKMIVEGGIAAISTATGQISSTVAAQFRGGEAIQPMENFSYGAVALGGIGGSLGALAAPVVVGSVRVAAGTTVTSGGEVTGVLMTRTAEHLGNAAQGVVEGLTSGAGEYLGYQMPNNPLQGLLSNYHPSNSGNQTMGTVAAGVPATSQGNSGYGAGGTTSAPVRSK